MIRAFREQGFTLLELMVAMALSAVIAMISAMALGSSADFYARNVLKQTKRSELKILENTLRPEWQLRVKSFKLTNNAIEFMTTQARESDFGSNAARVKYECNLNETLDFSLVHTSFELSLPSKPEGNSRNVDSLEQRRTHSVLLDNLKTCKFSALKNQGTKSDRPTTRWVSQWGEDDEVPKLIRLQIGDHRGDLPNYVFVAETL